MWALALMRRPVEESAGECDQNMSDGIDSSDLLRLALGVTLPSRHREPWLRRLLWAPVRRFGAREREKDPPFQDFSVAQYFFARLTRRKAHRWVLLWLWVNCDVWWHDGEAPTRAVDVR